MLNERLALLALRLEAAALRAADAAGALRAAWREIGPGRVRVLAIGKAAGAMLDACVERCGPAMSACLVVAPERVSVARAVSGVTECMVADHPYPTERSVAAGLRAEEFVREVRSDETLVVLLSGGGSALTCVAREGLSVADIAEMTRELQRAGVDITRLNLVRRHCERIKGGGLARVCGARRVIVYVLSDVLGDDLATIASGPFAPDATTGGEAAAVLRECGLSERLARVCAVLERGGGGSVADPRVEHVVIASNAGVARGVAEELRLVAPARGVELNVTGEASEVGRALARRVEELRGGAPCSWVIAGEYTVTVRDGNGVGGPSQELAATVAAELAGVAGWGLWAYSTDGRDGPSEAAGAVVDRATASAGNIRTYLEQHNTNEYLRTAGAVIPRRATGTNLNHVAALVVW